MEYSCVFLFDEFALMQLTVYNRVLRTVL